MFACSSNKLKEILFYPSKLTSNFAVILTLKPSYLVFLTYLGGLAKTRIKDDFSLSRLPAGRCGHINYYQNAKTNFNQVIN